MHIGAPTAPTHTRQSKTNTPTCCSTKYCTTARCRPSAAFDITNPPGHSAKCSRDNLKWPCVRSSASKSSPPTSSSRYFKAGSCHVHAARWCSRSASPKHAGSVYHRRPHAPAPTAATSSRVRAGSVSANSTSLGACWPECPSPFPARADGSITCSRTGACASSAWTAAGCPPSSAEASGERPSIVESQGMAPARKRAVTA